jgi:cytochrome c biogenesis protein CcdA
MLHVMEVVATLALADSLNPTTIAPALYLAAGDRPRSKVLEFAVAIFVVQLAGGVVIALGPGRLLLSALPALGATARHTIEIGLGVAMIVAAVLLWRHRSGLTNKDLPDPNSQHKSSLLLGAAISAVELPTAFPYFAAIAAVLGSGIDPAGQVLALALFNLCFVLPLVAILATLLIAGDQAQNLLTKGREFIQRRWPEVAALLLLLGGLFAIVLGATGFAASGHGKLARTVRHLRGTIHP